MHNGHGTIKIGTKTVQTPGGSFSNTGQANVGGGPAGMTFQEAASVQTPGGSGIMSQQQAQQAQQQINQQGPATAGGQTAEDIRKKRLEEERLEEERLAEVLANLGITEAQKKSDSLLGKTKNFAQGIMTNLMGGGEGGNLNLTKEEAYENLPAGMHPLRKQYEYLKEKYGPNWANTTQAKVLEGYLSGVPVERGGGLGARDDTYGGGKFAGVDQFGNPIDPEQFEVAEKFRQQLLNSMGLAGQDYEGQFMGSVADQLGALSDADYNKLRYGLSPEQFFNFNQQLMAADPSPENKAYKAARPFQSGAGLGALFEKFAPLPLKAVAGMFPERDLSGFENYADYEKAGAGFRPLPVPEQSDSNESVRRPGFMPIIPFPEIEERPRYPLPGDPKRPPIRQPFMPDGGNFPLPLGINAFNPMFLGPSFRGSPYTNQGVSPAFYENLRKYYG
jgi:hypothetical protein